MTMSGPVIVAVVVVIVVIVALVATNPMMRRREDEAIAAVKRQLGTVELIEPRTTAMGTDPEEAGGLRGMVCLGLSGAELMAVSWARGAAWRIPRASILEVGTTADDPAALAKATVTMSYARPDGGEATAMFRLRDAQDWLDALGQGEAADSGSGPGGGSSAGGESPDALSRGIETGED